MPSPAIAMQAIGYVQTDVPKEEIPRRRRTLISNVIVEQRYARALDGIAEYSHLFILFWMHEFDPANARLSAHPRGDETLRETGVFAARGRNRPNPIGLAVVDLLEHNGNRLTVKRLDAYDGTPVLDIKPYDHLDVFSEIQEPQWLASRRR